MEEKEIVKIVLDELTNRGFLRKNQNTFETTKELLRNLNKIESSVNHIQNQIDNLNIKAACLDTPKLPHGISFEGTNAETLLSVEQIEQRINFLKQSQIKITEFVKYVKNIIKTVLDENTQILVNKFYFEKVDVLDLCVEYNCESSTIYRKLNKAINSIKIEIFAEKFINELYS